MINKEEQRKSDMEKCQKEVQGHATDIGESWIQFSMYERKFDIHGDELWIPEEMIVIKRSGGDKIELSMDDVQMLLGAIANKSKQRQGTEGIQKLVTGADIWIRTLGTNKKVANNEFNTK